MIVQPDGARHSSPHYAVALCHRHSVHRVRSRKKGYIDRCPRCKRHAAKLSILVAPAGVTSIDQPCGCLFVFVGYAGRHFYPHIIYLIANLLNNRPLHAGRVHAADCSRYFAILVTYDPAQNDRLIRLTRWLANVLQFADYDIIICISSLNINKHWRMEQVSIRCGSLPCQLSEKI